MLRLPHPLLRCFLWTTIERPLRGPEGLSDSDCSVSPPRGVTSSFFGLNPPNGPKWPQKASLSHQMTISNALSQHQDQFRFTFINFSDLFPPFTI